MRQIISVPALRVFVRVAETGSLSRTAASLGIAQSVISRHIAHLESEFGGPLFHRTGRGVTPTELAAALLMRAKATVDAMDMLLLEAHDRASVPTGTVRIGVLHGISGVLPNLLYGRVSERLPRVRLQMIEGHSGEIEDWIASGHVSFGIMNRYRPGKWPGAQRLLTSPVCLVGRAASLVGVASPIGLQSMAQYPLVVPVMPNALTSRLDELAQRAKVKLNIAIEASGNTTLKSLIVNRGLFGVMPHHSCASELRAGTLQAIRIDERGLRATLVLVASVQRPLIKATREVMREIPPLVRKLVKDGVWTEIA
jgi:LysR family nitrogen assimilation transcriptional regulator